MTFARARTEWLERKAAEREANLRVLSIPTRARQGTYSGETSASPVEKENASQHSGYMAAVRDLGYCMRCRKSCRPQFCHRDCGKGMGLKTDVREGWPGCPECHYIVGTSGFYTKEQRRAEELVLGRRTREAVKAAGTWPARLAVWETA